MPEFLAIIIIILVCLALAYLVYCFLGAFIYDNKKKRLIIILIVAILGLTIYFYSENKHTVYMKEDVLYIKPSVDTSRTK